LNRPIDPALEQLVMRCLAKDPQQRPADAHVLLEELAACENVRPWSWSDARAWWRDRDTSRVAVTEAVQVATKTDMDRTMVWKE
jgi:hypothetical protein